MSKLKAAQISLRDDYQSRMAVAKQEEKELRKKGQRWSLFRLFYFFGALALLIFIFSKSMLWTVIGALIAILIFAWLIKKHIEIQGQANYQASLAWVNQEEIKIFDYAFEHRRSGEAYFEVDHLYAQDLDLFGAHSFFQYANRSSTALGDRSFANYLLMPGTDAAIVERQEASKELSKEVGWRQKLQALGNQIENATQDFYLLNKWLGQDSIFLQKWYIVPILIATPIWFVIGILLAWKVFSVYFLIIAWGIPLVILGRFVSRINEIQRLTSRAGDTLKQYAKLIEHIEEKKFNASLLQKLQSNLKSETIPASKSLKQLGYIVNQLDARNNAFVMVLNVIGLWDIYWVRRLELWKSKYAKALPIWFESFSELEALVSLATLDYNHPHWVYPEINSSQASMKTVNIAHPLIPSAVVVGNDFQSPTAAHLKLLTGSNMAGKSTFLRSLGLNTVLAMCGSPVCASSFSLPRLQILTSMRTHDALHESTSGFYAELKRLKIIIEAVEASRADEQLPQTFFLLDEILKGTNSRDRHAGSRALIQQLIKEKGAGIVATHDLELGSLENESKGAVENICIEVEVKDGELFFDYTLKKGLSKSFNATELMKRMGIKIEN